MATDMREFAQVQQSVAHIIDTHGRIDALVPSAGIHLSANIENTPESDFDELFAINVKGAFALVQAALPAMKEHGGSIVFIGSDQSLVGKKRSFAYNLSKMAIASMTKTTALDYAENNIRSNAVCPGTIDTPLYQQCIKTYCQKNGLDETQVHQEEAELQPLQRIGTAKEVADLVSFLLSDKAKFITGSLYAIDGGYTAQ